MSIFENTEIAYQLKSNNELRKAHALFRAVDSTFITNFGAWSLPWAIHIPGVKYAIKKTVFEQFCGGETRKESIETIDKLYEHKVGSILDYSIEGKDEEDEYEKCFQEIMAIIDLSKEKTAIPFVVFKPTGFGNIDIYEKVSSNKNLTKKEEQAWENIKNRFHQVAKKAYENDVTIMIDAEHSWMQDAVDGLVEDLMAEFNKDKCVVVNTLQMYRHDRLGYLKKQFEKAKKESYYIGFKIVRGAYMEIERERAKDKGYPSPIQIDKASTDRDYNAAVTFSIENHDKISLFAGTHNERSSQLLMNLLEKENLTKDYHKIWFGQLYGMSDNISFVLGKEGYNVAKYVPYGPVKDVIPYLIRRAQENTSVAGQSGRELMLITKELRRRNSK